MKTRLLLCFVALLLCSCSKKQQAASALPEDLFVRFYADKLIIQEESVLLHSDSTTTNHRIDSLYQAYNITSTQVQATIADYKTDVAKWKDFYDKVIQRLESLQQAPHKK